MPSVKADGACSKCGRPVLRYEGWRTGDEFLCDECKPRGKSALTVAEQELDSAEEELAAARASGDLNAILAARAERDQAERERDTAREEQRKRRWARVSPKDKARAEELRERPGAAQFVDGMWVPAGAGR